MVGPIVDAHSRIVDYPIPENQGFVPEPCHAADYKRAVARRHRGVAAFEAEASFRCASRGAHASCGVERLAEGKGPMA